MFVIRKFLKPFHPTVITFFTTCVTATILVSDFRKSENDINTTRKFSKYFSNSLESNISDNNYTKYESSIDDSIPSLRYEIETRDKFFRPGRRRMIDINDEKKLGPIDREIFTNRKKRFTETSFQERGITKNNNENILSSTTSSNIAKGSYSRSLTTTKRGFSFSGFVETIFTIVSTGISSIVNNIVGTESESQKKSRFNRVSYRGHQMLRITPTNEQQVADLKEMIEANNEGLKFWTMPIKNRSTDVVVAPDMISEIKDFLREQKFGYKVMINDLQKTISHENPKMSKEQREDLVTSKGHSMTWKRYHRYADIIRYLEYLAFTYPSLVELVTIGHSYEGLPLKLAKISNGPTKDGDNKPVVWIDGGMHAREWIGPAVATYILNQLVEKNATYKKLLDTSDWMILPVSNPDGYEFSHTSDRLWRKTRSNHGSSDSDNEEGRSGPMGIFHLVTHYTRWFFYPCEGVDPNRNFGFHWGEEEEGAASSDPCHETYAGPKAFSEPETQAIADYIMANKKSIKMYLTLHAYSQMWLVPWGYTKIPPPDFDELTSVARKATNAILKVHGTQYQVGASPDLLYPTSGGSDDWAKGVAGIKYSYTLELRDRGIYGFLLPAKEIVPTARETWAGIRAITRHVTCNT